MELTFERHKKTSANQTELVVTGDKLGLIIGFSDTTEGEHKKLVGSMMRLAKEQFKCDTPVDIYFQWKRKSFFIFNTDIKDLDNKAMNQLKNYAGKFKWGVIIDGKLLKKSSFNILVLNESDKMIIMDRLQSLFEYNIK